MKRKSVVIGAETGSGKTLAYLLPLVQWMYDDKFNKGIFTRKRQPRAVILVPSRDLGLQIYGIAKRYTTPLGLKTLPLFEGCNEVRKGIVTLLLFYFDFCRLKY